MAAKSQQRLAAAAMNINEMSSVFRQIKTHSASGPER